MTKTGPPPRGVTTPRAQGSAPATSLSSAWTRTALFAVSATLVLIWVLRETFVSMVTTWWRSETFTHGFIVVPASAFLIWTRRRELTSSPPCPSKLPLIAIMVAGAGWLLGRESAILVLEQAAAVGMVVATLWAILGTQGAGRIAFPLLFLFFAVPAGEILIDPLRNFTAGFTVVAMRAVGIPIFREGNYLHIPGGVWSIAEACSGFRYLLASITLGCLYAAWRYRSYGRRLAFVALSGVVPILTNGVRASLIVVLGYLSNMRLATGIDHYIYGWLLFCVMILGLFWVGGRWRENNEGEPEHAQAKDEGSAVVANEGSEASPAFTAFAAVALACLWPLCAWALASGPGRSPGRLFAPSPQDGWVSSEFEWTDWRPDYVGFDTTYVATFRRGDALVSVFLGLYADQRQEHELVNMQNLIVRTSNRIWRNVGQSHIDPAQSHAPWGAEETRIRSVNQNLMAWHWSWVAGEATTSRLWAKWLGARARLLRRSDAGALIVVLTPIDEHPEIAAQRLRAFMSDMLPSIQRSLREAAPNGRNSLVRTD